MQEDQCHVARLDKPLLVQVLSRLPLQQRVRSGSVCRSFKAAAAEATTDVVCSCSNLPSLSTWLQAHPAPASVKRLSVSSPDTDPAQDHQQPADEAAVAPGTLLLPLDRLVGLQSLELVDVHWAPAAAAAAAAAFNTGQSAFLPALTTLKLLPARPPFSDDVDDHGAAVAAAAAAAPAVEYLAAAMPRLHSLRQLHVAGGFASDAVLPQLSSLTGLLDLTIQPEPDGSSSAASFAALPASLTALAVLGQAPRHTAEWHRVPHLVPRPPPQQPLYGAQCALPELPALEVLQLQFVKIDLTRRPGEQAENVLEQLSRSPLRRLRISDATLLPYLPYQSVDHLIGFSSLTTLKRLQLGPNLLRADNKADTVGLGAAAGIAISDTMTEAEAAALTASTALRALILTADVAPQQPQLYLRAFSPQRALPHLRTLSADISLLRNGLGVRQVLSCCSSLRELHLSHSGSRHVYAHLLQGPQSEPEQLTEGLRQLAQLQQPGLQRLVLDCSKSDWQLELRAQDWQVLGQLAGLTHLALLSCQYSHPEDLLKLCSCRQLQQLRCSKLKRSVQPAGAASDPEATPTNGNSSRLLSFCLTAKEAKPICQRVDRLKTRLGLVPL